MTRATTGRRVRFGLEFKTYTACCYFAVYISNSDAARCLNTHTDVAAAACCCRRSVRTWRRGRKKTSSSTCNMHGRRSGSGEGFAACVLM